MCDRTRAVGLPSLWPLPGLWGKTGHDNGNLHELRAGLLSVLWTLSRLPGTALFGHR